jgi:putative Mg2+ transporter-C (MgtC) family protein
MAGEYLFRIILAGCLGAIIGYERKSRMKEAGLRTHFVVAVGSALIMVISKYGFTDIVFPGASIDPTRIAAQVVSGIGFLGAGTIIVQRQSVRGLTTAAGLWATSGIGLAIGAGMYEVGVGVTILVLVGLEVLDKGFRSVYRRRLRRLTLRVHDEVGAISGITTVLDRQNVRIQRFEITSSAGSEEDLTFDVWVKLPRAGDTKLLLAVLDEVDAVREARVR